jgi:hypothetical protein
MPDDTPTRSYGCSYGCGNPYDYVFVSVSDGTTEFLCLPCFLVLAQQLVTAVIDPSDPTVRAAMADATPLDQAPMHNGGVKRRGKNAPVTTDDDDLIGSFDSVITVDELPEAFR